MMCCPNSVICNLVTISCSNCCLVEPVKATWELAQTQVALTGPKRQQALQLMMTRLESKLAQTHVGLTDPTRQQVLQLKMTRLVSLVPYAKWRVVNQNPRVLLLLLSLLQISYYYTNVGHYTVCNREKMKTL